MWDLFSYWLWSGVFVILAYQFVPPIHLYVNGLPSSSFTVRILLVTILPLVLAWCVGTCVFGDKGEAIQALKEYYRGIVYGED